MLKFIVCEDNQIFLEKNTKSINKVMINNDIDYKIIKFNDYNAKLDKIINDDTFKIYILDIELGNYSGIDIARKIRKVDWNSMIIISTVHTELFPHVFRDRLMLFDYINKFDDYEENLRSAIEKIIEIYNKNKTIDFKVKNSFVKVFPNEILYIKFDKYIRKTIIETKNDKFLINSPLKRFEYILNSDFIKINRGCIINKSNVKELDYKNNTIYFYNNTMLENIKINKGEDKHDMVV